jgi:hypothetical protein
MKETYEYVSFFYDNGGIGGLILHDTQNDTRREDERFFRQW